jgi:hypothetical protein
VGVTLEAIKQAITELPEQEKVSLVAWLNEQDARAWDKQIEDDFSEGGAGAALHETWDAEIKTGGPYPWKNSSPSGKPLTSEVTLLRSFLTESF